MPQVSVVIPSYNRSHTIQRAVQSVLAQTHRDLQVIVVDDGSKDDTRLVLERLCKIDSRICYLCHDLNRGAQSARNTGIRAALGEWIAFLDSDDEWLPSSLEIRLAEARAKGVKVVHSDCYVVRDDGVQRRMGVPQMSGKIYRRVLSQPGPFFQGLLVRKEALYRIGYLDERIISNQEWETSIRLARHYLFGFVVEPTFVYDCRGKDTMSKDTLREARGYEQIVRKHFWSILAYVGPLALSRHYEEIAVWYKQAGDQARARRYKLFAFIWMPFRPGMIWRRLREFLLP